MSYLTPGPKVVVVVVVWAALQPDISQVGLFEVKPDGGNKVRYRKQSLIQRGGELK